MQIQVNTDDHIEGRDALLAYVEKEIRDTLSRFADRITRIEVHLGDENAGKASNADKRCMMEARPNGQPPLSVKHHAATLDEAMHGALKKLKTVLDGKFSQLHDHKGAESIRDLAG
jgi:ribosome-associated translation inhibitor RaiA